MRSLAGVAERGGEVQAPMDEPRAQRTLVKSPPELWAEISDAEALAGHLGEFGEIRITRADPETTVAWEGDRARGTVELEPTAWGTKVTLTAEVAEERVTGAAGDPEPEPEPVAEPAAEPQPDPEPVAEPAPEPAPRRGFLARLFGRREVEPAEPPAAPPPPAPEPELAPPTIPPVVELAAAPESPAPEPPTPEPLGPERAQEILSAVLDDLGSAHHRPFSR
jgi:hypothetical protein